MRLILIIISFLYFHGIQVAYAQILHRQKEKSLPAFEAEESIYKTSISTTPYAVENLATLGKIWGFLKYYHPSIAQGKYNWDEELLKIIPKILGSKNIAARNKLLVDWINHLGNLSSGTNPEVDSALVKMFPDYSWINREELGEKLWAKLHQVKQAKREPTHYYVAFDSFPHPKFTNENAYAEMTYPSTAYRLLSLFRYWNVIQYFFPYRYLLDDSWHEVLQEFIPRFIDAENELAYKLAVLKLITRINDTHAAIGSSEPVLEQFKGSNMAPVEITFIEGKAVVSGYLDKEYANKNGLQKGDIIEAVNKKPVNAILQERWSYTPASNDVAKLREIAWDLLRTNDSLMHLRYRRNTIIEEVTVPCKPRYLINPYQRIQKEDTCFRMLSIDVAYIFPWTIKAAYYPQIMQAIAHTKGLIIDLRYVPGDDMYLLGEYLFSAPQHFATLTKGSLLFPGLFTYWKNMEIGKINPHPYQGKIVILNNEHTQSAAEFITMEFSSVPNAVVVGSTTSGADGSVSRLYLPGGILTSFTGSGVYYPDGRETQRIGIVPDIEIKPTIRGIKEGRDEVLEKAIEVISH